MFDDLGPSAVIALVAVFWGISILRGVLRKLSGALVKASQPAGRSVQPDVWLEGGESNAPPPPAKEAKSPWEKSPRSQKPMASKSGAFRSVTSFEPDRETETVLPAAVGNVRFKTPDEIILATFGRVTRPDDVGKAKSD